MKRFLLFVYDDYYAWGGAQDFVGDFESLEEIEDWLKEHISENASYIDVETGVLARRRTHYEVSRRGCSPGWVTKEDDASYYRIERVGDLGSFEPVPLIEGNEEVES